MSWVFTIAGDSTVRVNRDTWQEQEKDFRGVFRRLATGFAVNSQRNPKRGFTCTVFFTDAAALDTFEAAISEPGMVGVAKPITISSSADGPLRGVQLVCYCWITRIDAVANGDSAYWKAQLNMREA